MGKVTWTDEQLQAIQARDCNLLVAAAAGSGKTAVLVERIIQRVLDPKEAVDIDRLLVVTFTEAAASEMRERIGKAISERMNELFFQEDTGFRKQLKRQLTLLNRATISTMHSFCSKLIRKNFNKVELDPNFRVLDAIEADLLKEEAMDQMLQQQYEEMNEIFDLLLDVYGGTKGDDTLKKLLLRIYEETSSNPFPKRWRDEAVSLFAPEALEQYTEDFSKSPWGAVLIQMLKRELPDWIFRCEQAMNLCEEGGNLAHISAFAYHKQYFETVLAVADQDWDCVCNAIQAYSFLKRETKTKGCDPAINERTDATFKEMTKTVKKYRESYFAKNTEENIKEQTEAYEMLKGLTRLVDIFTDLYATLKRQKGALDYDDLEHFALKILTEYPDVAAELQDFYEEVYTDEYQDTNMTQETILQLVTRRPPKMNNLFMVGDVKQSIYGFRQARPDIFLEKYYRYYRDETAEDRKILLYMNFRSRQDVIGSVNYIFSKLMTKEVCGMDYTTQEYLNPGAKYDAPTFDVACEVLVTDFNGEKKGDIKEEEWSEEEEEQQEQEEKEKSEVEAILIAKRIKALLQEAKGKLRYKDIVILLRTPKERADIFAEGLSNMGIPAFCDTNASFYQSKEGKVMVSLLQIIDNPLQDIPMLSVLKSPIAGFTEPEIAQMRLQNRKSYLYYNLKALAEQGIEKAVVFLEKLQMFRTYATEHTLSELLLELYSKTDYYHYAGVLTDGAQRQANLRKMQEEAVKYETQTGGGIFEFLAYIEKIKSSEGDLGGATLLGENDDVVRIMSIHKSKGLEFPVVFLANMDKQFNRQDERQSLLLHQELGFGVEHFEREYRVKNHTASKMAIRERKNQEMIAEEFRLLYVAMTRAKEKLILCGTVDNIKNKIQKYWEVLSDKNDVLPARFALKARSYFDFVFPLLLRHPDLQGARELADMPNSPFAWRIPGKGEACQFRFSFVEKETLLKEVAAKKETDAEVSGFAKGDIGMLQEIEKRFSASYAYSKSTDIPAKVSVSYLNHKETMPQMIAQPRFMEGKRKRTAAEWGTITHYVLQYISLDAISKETIQNLCRKQGLTEEEVQAFRWETIVQFFESGIGKRMRQAKKVYREKAFTMEISAKQFFSDLPEDNTDAILVQGMIDCYFEEEDGIVILDYKTDRVQPGEEQQAAETYRMQLALYQQAVEAETELKVKEKCIYFLQTGEYVVQ